MDLSKKQYQKMVGNKPAKKQKHHSLATVMAKKMVNASDKNALKKWLVNDKKVARPHLNIHSIEKWGLKDINAD